MRSDDGSREIVYLIESMDSDCVVVMLPWVPTPMAGSIKIVERQRIEPLDASLGEVTKVLGHWGAGTRALLGPAERSSEASR